MKQHQLETTALKVSAVGPGCNNFGLRIDSEAARPVIHKALYAGITFAALANVLGGQLQALCSSERIGRAVGVRGSGREACIGQKTRPAPSFACARVLSRRF